MTDVTGEWDKALAALKADPASASMGLASLLGAGALCLVWDMDGRQLLWASPEASLLARHLAGLDGRLDPDSQFGARLRELGQGLAPRDGIRLERLRVGRVGMAAPMTFACRLISSGDQTGVLTVAIGEVPKLRVLDLVPKAQEPTPVAAAAAQPAEPAFDPAPPTPAREPSRAAPSRRFIWHTDQDGRFTLVSPALAGLVGPQGADILGRRWSEITGRLVHDVRGSITAGFAGQSAWSHALALWRLGDSGVAIPVVMAAAPAFGSGGAFHGFRGFGIADPTHIQRAPAWHAAPLSHPVAVEAPSAADAGQAVSAGTPETAPGPVAEPHVAELESEPLAATAVTEDGGPAEATSHDETADAPSDDAEPEHGPAIADDAAVEPASVPDEPVQAAPPAEEVEEPASRLAPPYKPAETLHPVFRALLDASLSGLSQFIAALPTHPPAETAKGEPEAEAGDDASAAADRTDIDPGGSAQAEQIEPQPALDEPEPEAQVERTDAAMDEPHAAAELHAVGFGPLRARIGGQLGGSRAVPLRLAPVPAPESQPAEVQAPSRPGLSFAERGAFHEIARALGARIEGDDESAGPAVPRVSADIIQMNPPRSAEADGLRVIEGLPIGVLVHRGEATLFANRFLLEIAGYPDLAAFMVAGGASRLSLSAEPDLEAGAAALRTAVGESLAVTARSATLDWADAPASVVLITPLPVDDPSLRVRALDLDLAASAKRLGDAAAVLEVAADGVLTLDGSGRILSLNRAAEHLFGYDQREIAGEGIAVLLAPESHREVLGALEAFRVGEDRQHELTEVVGRSRGGDRISLSLTLGRIGQGDGPATCVVIRNASRLKQAEAALSQAKRARDRAGQQATDFLTRISHEIRTPLNAIIGFAEVMLEERLGAVGSERYKSYLTDIRDSGAQVIKLVDDLLDLSKAMAGRTTVPGEGVELNDALMRGVASLQPAAARARVVLRTSFSSGLPPVLIDERSLGQVIDSLLSNAIRFTEAGGQVIASTAMTDQNEVALRIRDTGIGMSHDELEAALEPFRQVSTTRSNEGRGLGLPLARALVEANDGAFAISSEPGEGTLVEILFARSRLDTDHEA